jgi:hypothetical protein
MNKRKNLTFRLIFRKQLLGPSRFEPTKKLNSGLYPVNRMSNQFNKISLLSFFSWQLDAKTVYRYRLWFSRNRHEKGEPT